MSDGMDLYIELQSKVAMLDRALSQMKNRGRAAAQAEEDYRVALAQKLLFFPSPGPR